MNSSILKKCLLELSAEKPRIDYVKGMLETLIEMQEDIQLPLPAYLPVFDKTNPPPPASEDAATFLDARAKAALKTVQDLAAQSTDKS